MSLCFLRVKSVCVFKKFQENLNAMKSSSCLSFRDATVDWQSMTKEGCLSYWGGVCGVWV